MAQEYAVEELTKEEKLTRDLEALESKYQKVIADNMMMAKVLKMYAETPLPDVFGDPYYFANQALERRNVKT